MQAKKEHQQSNLHHPIKDKGSECNLVSLSLFSLGLLCTCNTIWIKPHGATKEKQTKRLSTSSEPVQACPTWSIFFPASIVND